MGNRLSKIVTKTGDGGTTGLGNGDRVRKTALRIEVIGEVDELNSWIGLALTKIGPMTRGCLLLRETQHRLFDLGAELSVPGLIIIEEADVEVLENDTEILNQELPPLKNFILPGGTQACARLHTARAICRRAERHLWRLDETEEVNPSALRYLNRLSDFLFVMARQESKEHPVLWRPKPKKE